MSFNVVACTCIFLVSEIQLPRCWSPFADCTAHVSCMYTYILAASISAFVGQTCLYIYIYILCIYKINIFQLIVSQISTILQQWLNIYMSSYHPMFNWSPRSARGISPRSESSCSGRSSQFCRERPRRSFTTLGLGKTWENLGGSAAWGWKKALFHKGFTTCYISNMYIYIYSYIHINHMGLYYIWIIYRDDNDIFHPN